MLYERINVLLKGDEFLGYRLGLLMVYMQEGWLKHVAKWMMIQNSVRWWCGTLTGVCKRTSQQRGCVR